MSKLFKVKKWLSVEDAAKHLAIVFGEKVNEADVLRFALDGQLKLSVNFLNRGIAKIGKLVPIGEATYKELPMLTGDGTLPIYGGPTITTGKGESYILELNADVVSLSGVYDLPMIGGERLDVEHRFQALTGGPEITMITLDGSFVEGRNGVMCQVQEEFGNNEKVPSFIAALKRLKKYFSKNKINKTEAKKILEKGKSRCFYAAESLPNDCIFVVRTAALTDFVQSVNEEPASTEKPLGTIERNTLLTIVAALCKDAEFDHTKHAKTAKMIQSTADGMGLSIGETTIEGHLKKIPNALESRMK